MAAYISFQPRDHYKTITYAGTGSGAKVVTGVGFQPDFTWFKQYDATRSWVQIDSVQGVSKAVSSDGDAAQQSNANYLASFDSDGFTTGATQDNGTNTSGGNYVSYSWKAGTTSGLATNGSTTITPSSYSFNQTTGISIITYAGNGTSGAKLAHGLGQVPAVFFVKCLSSTNDWRVYHQHIHNTDPEDNQITLNTSGGIDNQPDFMNDNPCDSVNIELGNQGKINSNGETYIMYVYAEKKGFSKFGEYEGDGSTNGFFCYTGFRPSMVLIKNTDSSTNWMTWDIGQSPNNEMHNTLFPHNTNAQNTTTTDNDIDFLCNGFKIREDNGDLNNNGAKILFFAWAEFPLVSSNGLPCTAK